MLPVWIAGWVCALAGERIGDIEYFGAGGLDLAKVRDAMPVREGDEYSKSTEERVRLALTAAIGKPPTDVASICCDEKGNRLLFIGLPGGTSRAAAYHPEPKGAARLPRRVMNLYKRLDRALEAAARRGGEAAEEDHSNGYALAKDPAARSLQLNVRAWAVDHEQELLRVLEFSGAVSHRRVASDAIGYARQSRGQILAMVRAARDPDEEVRNNATRGLGVLARSNAAAAREIPPETFIDMLHSGTWTDRNKATALLMAMTASRDAVLLGKLRAGALDALREMASWRRPGHAYFARMVLGRVAGVAEERLQELAWKGPVAEILAAAEAR